MKQFVFLIFTKILFCYESELNLLNLSKHWQGNGVSVLYPLRLKLLSNQLKNQVGMMTSPSKIPGGDNWELDVKVKANCLNIEKDRANFGFALWLTQNPIDIAPKSYIFEKFQNRFGMSDQIDGLMLLFYKNTLHSSLMKAEILHRNQMILKSKPCKFFPDKNNDLNLRVIYTGSDILGIYTVDTKTMRQQLCIQYSDVKDFHLFYLSVSASDQSSKCSFNFDKMFLKSNFKLVFVNENEKKMKDPNFAYFSEDQQKIHNHMMKFETHEEYLKQNKNIAKILSKEVLQFADLSEKEIKVKIKQNLVTNLTFVDEALFVIKTEARLLENLSQIIVKDKKKKKGDMNEVFDQMFEWIKQMKVSYDTVTGETGRIYELLNNIDLSKNIIGLAQRSQTIVDRLDSILFKTQKINKHDIKLPTKNNIIHMQSEIQRMKIKKNSFKKNIFDSLVNLRNIGIIILGCLALGIFIAFLSMYLRIRKINEQKRILQLSQQINKLINQIIFCLNLMIIV